MFVHISAKARTPKLFDPVQSYSLAEEGVKAEGPWTFLGTDRSLVSPLCPPFSQNSLLALLTAWGFVNGIKESCEMLACSLSTVSTHKLSVTILPSAVV